MPVVFEKNDGHSPEEVRFIVRKIDHSVFFLDNKVLFSSAPSRAVSRPEAVTAPRDKTNFVAMEFVDAQRQTPRIEHLLKARGLYVGGQRGRQPLTLAAGIVYRAIYPGIDLHFHNAEGRMRYEFVLTPRARAEPHNRREREPHRACVNRNAATVRASCVCDREWIETDDWRAIRGGFAHRRENHSDGGPPRREHPYRPGDRVLHLPRWK